MNRRNRTLLVLLLAVALASAASYGVYRTIARMPVRQVEVASTRIAVAATNLPVGTRIEKDQVKLVGWPASSPVAGSFTSVDDVVGRGLIQPVAANEPLTDAKLASIEAGAGLPPSIPTGMRAMSVKVNEVIGVAGFTVPGTRVDVLVTLDARGGTEGMTRAVVSNVQVLTAGTRMDQQQAKDGKPMPSTVVTLLLTPDDAERIALAQTAGSLMLVLRNPLDVAPTETRGVRMASLMAAPDPQPVVKVFKGQPRVVTPPPAAPQEPKGYSVEAIRAAKRTEEVIR
jgi:pilus assembly protein CpaB